MTRTGALAGDYHNDMRGITKSCEKDMTWHYNAVKFVFYNDASFESVKALLFDHCVCLECKSTTV